QVHGLVGLRAGMGLDVGVVGAEELPGAVDGQLLRHVDVLAAAVVALAGVPLGVLVGELAALGLHDPRAGVVLAGDQLDVVLLAAVLGGDRRGQFRIVAFDACVAREHLRSRGRGDGHCSPRPGPRGPGRGTVRTGPDATGPGPPGPPERFAGGTGPAGCRGCPASAAQDHLGDDAGGDRHHQEVAGIAATPVVAPRRVVQAVAVVIVHHVGRAVAGVAVVAAPGPRRRAAGGGGMVHHDRARHVDDAGVAAVMATVMATVVPAIMATVVPAVVRAAPVALDVPAVVAAAVVPGFRRRRRE